MTFRSLSLLLALSALLSATGCNGEAPLDPTVARSARVLAAAEFESGQLERAREALAPLLERSSPDPEDVLRAAIVDLALFEPEAARAKLESIQDELGDRADHAYCLGLSMETAGDLEAALPHYRRAHERRPTCFPTRLKLASTLRQLGHDEEAIEHYEGLLAVGVDEAGSWHMTVLYQLGQLLLFQSDSNDRAGELLEQYNQLDERGLSVPAEEDLDRGELASSSRRSRPGSRSPLRRPRRS